MYRWVFLRDIQHTLSYLTQTPSRLRRNVRWRDKWRGKKQVLATERSEAAHTHSPPTVRATLVQHQHPPHPSRASRLFQPHRLQHNVCACVVSIFQPRTRRKLYTYVGIFNTEMGQCYASSRVAFVWCLSFRHQQSFVKRKFNSTRTRRHSCI